MRTISHIKNIEKRKKISYETLEIYAPLAERLGMQEVRSELDDLSFAVIEPEIRDSILQRLQLLRQQDENVLQQTIKKIEELLDKKKIDAKIFGREKKPYSIWKKMKVKSVNFSQLSDIMGFTILLESIDDCYNVLGLLHQKYSYVPGRFKDYISTPKPNGYQSLHTTLIGPINRRIEIQVRTFKMNDQADLGVAAHWIYKEKVDKNEGKQYKGIRQILDILDQSKEPEEFLEHTKLQMYAHQVFVFTPSGDLISLPKGAMPLDFAFLVHTDIGSNCIGVKVNNSIKPLYTKLKNGDQVEILTGKENVISPKWLELSITGKARACIKRYLHIKEDDEFKKLGKEIIVNEFKIQKIRFSEESVKTVLGNFKLKNSDELFLKIGKGELIPSKIIFSLFPEKSLIESNDKIILLNEVKQKRQENKTILLEGLTPGMSVHYASCCNPIPGDSVMAYISEGKGLVIHVDTCEEIKKLKISNSKIISVRWENFKHKKKNFVAKINVIIKNKIGSLGSLSSIIGRSMSNIRNLKITDKSDFENLKNIYKSKQSVGIGFDVHKLVAKRKFYLAGLRIKSKVGTLGHSDGDPVLHSVTDSILGACQMGDIGQMFSDKNKKFKNIRSTILLKHVVNQIKSKGYLINNIDINIITQTPKIKNLKNRMVKNIVNLCEISNDQINIKGKTTEKLGVIGKEKAIACEVICSVIKYD